MIKQLTYTTLYLSKRYKKKKRDDLVGGHALMFMFYQDIEHTNAVACDTSFATADVRRLGYAVLGGRGHASTSRSSSRVRPESS